LNQEVAMWKKTDVYLTIEDIEKKYPDFFKRDKKAFAEFICLLFDVGFLRGYYDRHKRKIFILEESWIDLLKHRNYNLSLQMYNVSDNPKFSIPPPYCNDEFPKTYIYDKYLYTPTELLKLFEFLKCIPAFTTKFINMLVKTGMVRGNINLTEPYVEVLLPSFIEFLKYRDWVIQKNLIHPANLG
jgi:hypothetical protein